MGRNSPSRRIRHRFGMWRDRRRYPWRYPEKEPRRFRRRARHSIRRRYFVVRALEDAGQIDHYIFAECPNYTAAMEVAAPHGDQVFTESRMREHPDRHRALTAWDKGDDPQGRQSAAIGSPRRTSNETLSTIEAPNG